MKRYTAPKAILSHPGVLECLSAEAGGCDAAEYTHDVFLKEGWVFKYGRNAGCRSCHFKTVADFRAAEPVRTPEKGPALLEDLFAWERDENGRVFIPALKR